MHVDFVTRKTKMLFSKDKNIGFEQLQDSVISTPINDPGTFLIQASKTSSPKFSVYKANANTRKLPSRRVEGSQSNIVSWNADVLGNVRFGRGFTADQKTAVLKLKDADDVWHDYSYLLNGREAEVLALPTLNLDLVYLQMFAALGPGRSNIKIADLETDGGEEGAQIYRSVYEFNVRTGKEKKLFGRSDSEVANIVLDEQGRSITAVE